PAGERGGAGLLRARRRGHPAALGADDARVDAARGHRLLGAPHGPRLLQPDVRTGRAPGGATEAPPRLGRLTSHPAASPPTSYPSKAAMPRLSRWFAIAERYSCRYFCADFDHDTSSLIARRTSHDQTEW